MRATGTARLAPKLRTPIPLRPRHSRVQLLARADALAQLIDALDVLEADCDLEPEEDRCAAGDDTMTVTPRALGYPGDRGASCDDFEDSDGAEADTDY